MPVGELVSLVAGAALGLSFQIIYEGVKKAKDRSVFDRLHTTINRVTPLIAQIDQHSEGVEDSPLRKVNERLKLLVGTAVCVVEAYAGLGRRNLSKKYRFVYVSHEIPELLLVYTTLEVALVSIYSC